MIYSEPMIDLELDEHVARLRRQSQDDAFVEVKAAAGGFPKSAWESISAFANTDGGLLILGLDEQAGFTPAGGFAATRILATLLSGLDSADGAHPKVTPVPPFEPSLAEVDGEQVVTVRVHPLIEGPGITAPCFVTDRGMEKGSYKRVGDADRHLSPYEIYLLRTRHASDRTDREELPDATVAELDSELVARTLDGLRRNTRALRGIDEGDIEGGLRRVNALGPHSAPTLAGFLALDAYPQREFPQLFIDVTAHLGTAKSTDPTVRFLDRRRCDGPLPQAIDDAVTAVQKNLSSRRIVDGVSGTDEPEIPTDVIREAVTNAVLHRDYSTYVRGQQVAVDIFADRVEVRSPGGFWGDRTKENVTEGYSEARNESLVQLMTAVPMPDGRSTVAENQGSGVLHMVNAMRGRGLPAPDYSASTIDHVVVRLARFGLISSEVRDWLDQLPARDERGHHHDVALAIARMKGQVSVPDLRNNLGLDSDECRDVLSLLVANELLIGIGDGAYALSDMRSTPTSSGAQWEILSLLDTTNPLSIGDIATATGKNRNALRPLLRELVEQGVVVATAPPQSRNRKYLLAAAP